MTENYKMNISTKIDTDIVTIKDPLEFLEESDIIDSENHSYVISWTVDQILKHSTSCE